MSVSQQVVFLVHDGRWQRARVGPFGDRGPASVTEDSGQCGGGEWQSGAQWPPLTSRGVSNILRCFSRYSEIFSLRDGFIDLC